MERFSPSERSGGFGLTMSEEGGFDDVAEFFLAAANCAHATEFGFKGLHLGREDLALGTGLGCRVHDPYVTNSSRKGQMRS